MAVLSYCLATSLLLAGAGVRCQPAPAPVGVQGVKSFATDQVPEFDVLTEQAQRSTFPARSFISDFSGIDTKTPGGQLAGFFINNDEALATLPGAGVGQNLVTLQPCAVNQPHVHPRGTEISHITQGQLLFGFVEENGGRFISANLTVGQTVVVPQGLMHFAQNLGCSPAQFIASFPTRDPGTQTIGTNFFTKLPMATLRATLGLNDSQLQPIINQVATVQQSNPSLDLQCLQACSMPAPINYYNQNPSGTLPNGY